MPQAEKKPVDDDALYRAYGAGKKSAFDVLYQRYKQPIYNYLYRSCSDSQDADELFQQVWLRVVAAAANYRSHGRFRSWLFTVAHNCIVDFYRKYRPPESEFVDDHHSENPDYETMDVAGKLRFAISQLPADQRQAFYLRQESGFSVREIAVIQGIESEAAKSRLRYAYEKLRLLLGEIK